MDKLQDQLHSKYLELLGRIEEVESSLRELRSGQGALKKVTLRDRQSGALAEISYDASTDDIRVERIR